ncbi:HAD family hydrolase [Paenibacillus rhizophilus]|uniref:HAD family hydrolase n=1 Tax=Paenibacillus rhizophilus TaxID=1850366 RepID=UPI001639C597|nr:HAD family hydrolase [Paenibacillus rhizophilus]
MNNFEVISLDMFQTLVNVDSRIEQIWRPILQNNFTAQFAEEYAKSLLKVFFTHWIELRKTGQFQLMNEIYERSFIELFKKKAIQFDAGEAVKILFREHTLSQFYDETIDFLDSILKRHKVCIVSDADDAMIPNFYERYGVHLFTSEQHQSYKNDDRNTMFKELLKFYRIAPKQVLHVGDSASDILGASREGIVTCWINRNNRAWEYGVKPDYIIESLNEMEDILFVQK